MIYQNLEDQISKILKDKFEESMLAIKCWKGIVKDIRNKYSFVCLGTGDYAIDRQLLLYLKKKNDLVFLSTQQDLCNEDHRVRLISLKEREQLLVLYSFYDFDDKFICFDIDNLFGQGSKKIIEANQFSIGEIIQIGLLKGTIFESDKEICKV